MPYHTAIAVGESHRTTLSYPFGTQHSIQIVIARCLEFGIESVPLLNLLSAQFAT